jgi:hypothetical protein
MSSDESYIVKAPDVTSIVKTADKDSLAALFESPLPVLVEAITGWLAAGPKAWTLSAGHIIQGAFKARLFQQVADEIESFRRQGKIPGDFAEKKNGFQTWVELFTTIDQDAPDGEQLDALKAMFYAVNKVNSTDATRILGYQLFQIAKRLNSNELLVLKTAYRLQNQNEIEAGRISYLEWTKKIAFGMGQLVSGLVDHADTALVDNKLFHAKFDNDLAVPAYRVTDLGIAFCKNIETYNIDKTTEE